MADEEGVEQVDGGTYNAADAKQVNNAKRAAGRLARDDADVIRKLMHTQQGRSWMWRKLTACRAFAPSYMPGQQQLTDTAYYEGQRAIGLELLAEVMGASRDLYLLMHKEQTEQNAKP